MAHATQELKTRIGVQLKSIIPKSWRWTMSIKHHSTLELNIASAPVDLLAEISRKRGERRRDYFSVNPHHVAGTFIEHSELFAKILAAMNDGNHDRSDLTTDYHDVGWYLAINIGRWNRPFEVTP